MTDELDAAFTEMRIAPPTIELERQISETREQAAKEKQSLYTKLAPFRSAAQITHSAVDKIPEVILLQEESAAKVVALEAQAQDIEKKLERVQTILRGVQR